MALSPQRLLDEKLWKAAEAGDLDGVKKAKEEGASTTWMHPSEPPGRGHQFSCLHIASDRGHADVVKWLVEKGGAELNKKLDFGETAYEHVRSRAETNEGLKEVTAYLKMKVAMQAVMAANKFAALQKKKSTGGEASAPATAVA